MLTSAKLLAVTILILPVAAAAAPIMVVMDLHADPMFGSPSVQEQVYNDWVDYANWLLDVTDTSGRQGLLPDDR